ncbi:Helix-hairpin-helix DNA-binding motif class 1 [Fragilaria crotonensis]|nr:Helix-hairpin-helix DNA-binding motif class 1 [Fragilaria crotonensis]
MSNTASRKRSLVATPMESELVTNLLKDAGIKVTTTKGSWCLHEGLSHVISVNDQSLRPIVLSSGPPRVYESIECRHQDAVQSMTNPKSCFESLCRIVAGQQLAGAAAHAVWQRLLETSHHALTPKKVLELAQQGLAEKLQKPAGLSGAKARSILDLAEKFEAGILSDAFLETAAEHEVREALLKVRGIGPWSCDMFLLFYLERPDIMPLGDLGVRKGIAKHFGLRGTGKHGTLCQKNDVDRMNDAAKPYAPYRSLLSFYMWKVADKRRV